jgi:hypothetical protein
VIGIVITMVEEEVMGMDMVTATDIVKITGTEIVTMVITTTIIKK